MMKSIQINILLIFFISLVGCSVFKNEPKINAFIDNQDLVFSFEKKDIMLLGYEVNSLETFKEDGVTYKNIIKYQNNEGFYDVVIRDFKNNNILDNHAYYLMVSKEGAKFQTLGFCIKNNLVQIQNNKKDDQGFIEKCHK